MIPVSPQMFATALTGALRLGREGYIAYIDNVTRNQDLEVLVPVPNAMERPSSPEEREDMIYRWVSSIIEDQEWYKPLAPFEGVFETSPDGRIVRGDRNRPVIATGREDLFETAIEQQILAHQQRQGGNATSPGHARQRMIVYHHKNWANPDNNSPWARFFRHAIDVGLDIVSIQPGLLGTGGNVQALFSALAPNLAASFNAEDEAPLRRQLAETFAEASLKTIVDHPNLVTDEKRWQPLVQGLLTPLQEEVEKDGSSALQVLTTKRLRHLMEGPIAHGVLTALSDNSNAFLKGSLDDQKILGQVVRETLGVAASSSPAGFRVRQAFTDDGLLAIFNASLTVARDRPELFLKATNVDDEVVFGRKMLSGLADTLMGAPRPFRPQDGLAADLASMALGVAGDYASVRLAANASGHDSSLMGVDIANHLLRDMLSGLDRAIRDDNNAAEGSIFTRMFSRSQAIDVLQIMGTHIAQAPHLIVGDSPNPRVELLAESIGLAVSSDTTGLLTADHWRGVISTALDVALDNPGRLFGTEGDTDPQKAVAFALINRILGTARDNLAGPTGEPGRILFGRTLADAMRVTLRAAGSGALSIMDDPVRQATHINAVEGLMNKLNGLAASNDPSKVISADDWMAIYSFYIAHMLETGPAALDGLTDEALLSVLKSSTTATAEG